MAHASQLHNPISSRTEVGGGGGGWRKDEARTTHDLCVSFFLYCPAYCRTRSRLLGPSYSFIASRAFVFVQPAVCVCVCVCVCGAVAILRKDRGVKDIESRSTGVARCTN